VKRSISFSLILKEAKFISAKDVSIPGKDTVEQNKNKKAKRGRKCFEINAIKIGLKQCGICVGYFLQNKVRYLL
jgi:hypothetical protein